MDKGRIVAAAAVSLLVAGAPWTVARAQGPRAAPGSSRGQAGAADCPPITDGVFDPVPGDINGDGTSDLVVGVRGGIDVVYRQQGGVLLDSRRVGRFDHGFGTAAASVDLDGDPCTDLVVGASNAGSGAGEVLLVHGPVGPTPTPATVITPPDSQPGDDFGAALTVTSHRDGTGNLVTDLWVGAPGHTVAGRSGAGAVYHYTLDAGQATYVQELNESQAVVPGVAAAGDHFGAVLSPGDESLAVGMPDRAVFGHPGAGQVDLLGLDPVGDQVTAGRVYTQDSPGVYGVVTSGNHFGAALSGGGRAVGAPDAAIGRATHAGLVEIFRATGVGPSATLSAQRALSENTAGVPGTAETGDRFGAAVSVAIVQCKQGVHVAIGVPGESIGPATRAGAVELVAIDTADALTKCVTTALSAGHGLPGSPQSNAQLGQRLGLLAPPPGLDEDALSTLLIGAPGASVVGVAGAGQLSMWQNNRATVTTDVRGPQPGAAFGSVLPAT